MSSSIKNQVQVSTWENNVSQDFHNMPKWFPESNAPGRPERSRKTRTSPRRAWRRAGAPRGQPPSPSSTPRWSSRPASGLESVSGSGSADALFRDTEISKFWTDFWGLTGNSRLFCLRSLEIFTKLLVVVFVFSKSQKCCFSPTSRCDLVGFTFYCNFVFLQQVWQLRKKFSIQSPTFFAQPPIVVVVDVVDRG